MNFELTSMTFHLPPRGECVLYVKTYEKRVCQAIYHAYLYNQRGGAQKIIYECNASGK